MSTATSPKLDVEGYPMVCSVCEKKIVKSHGLPIVYLYDHTTGKASSRHAACAYP